MFQTKPAAPRPASSHVLARGMVATAMAALAVYLLLRHIYYMNHLSVADWDFRYLYVNRGNHLFIEKLRRMKVLVALLWVMGFAFVLWYTEQVLARKGRKSNVESLKRFGIALPVLLLGLVNYNPPDIDLSLYFFINTACYSLLAVALWKMPWARTTYTKIGRYIMEWRSFPTGWLLSLSFGFIAITAYYLAGPFFGRLPLTVDTNAQLAHAKIMLEGHWTTLSHPLRDFFNMWMMINGGKFYSQYPPGHVFFLTIGAYFERRTLVNPILGGFNVLGVYWLAQVMYGRKVARIAALLTCTSMYLIAMSGEFMMNVTSLLSVTLFLTGYFLMLKKPSMMAGLLGGVGIGYCVITRPYSAAGVAVPFIIHAIMLLMMERKTYFKPLMSMAAAGMFFVLFQLYFNVGTTGHPLVFGYERSWGSWHIPLSGAAMGKLNKYEIEKNFRENLQRMAWFSRVTLEWPLPTLVLLALIYGWRGARRQEKLLYLSIISAMASCQILPGNVEQEWGPRLLFETLSIQLVLYAKALTLLPAFGRVVLPRRRLAFYYGYGAVMLVFMYAFSFAHNLRIDVVMNIYNYQNRGGNPAFYHHIRRSVQTPAVVFVSGLAYQAVSFENPPKDDHRIIYANDLNEQNAELSAYYPDRYAYRAFIGPKGFVVEPLP